jgi:hypothetical protein
VDGVFLLEGGETAAMVMRPVDSSFGGQVSVTASIVGATRDENQTLHCRAATLSPADAQATQLFIDVSTSTPPVWSTIATISGATFVGASGGFQRRSQVTALPSVAVARIAQLRVRAVYPGGTPSGPGGALWAIDSVVLSVVPRTQLAGVTLVTAYPTSGPSDGTRNLTVEYGVRAAWQLWVAGGWGSRARP